eukprot:NODE_12059_length_1248_cov_4.672614.p2 GENE.NODE_12059_length_1248_cov_4.672614~~NODE_12059_length_1248_cov_4.672614.p2  ORF type:complete len:207 (-),score=32.20 NODE_12059_length_1248_cov_4.672614:110-730(-)
MGSEGSTGALWRGALHARSGANGAPPGMGMQVADGALVRDEVPPTPRGRPGVCGVSSNAGGDAMPGDRGVAAAGGLVVIGIPAGGVVIINGGAIVIGTPAGGVIVILIPAGGVTHGSGELDHRCFGDVSSCWTARPVAAGGRYAWRQARVCAAWRRGTRHRDCRRCWRTFKAHGAPRVRRGRDAHRATRRSCAGGSIRGHVTVAER